jgi:hypothetical protein
MSCYAHKEHATELRLTYRPYSAQQGNAELAGKYGNIFRMSCAYIWCVTSRPQNTDYHGQTNPKPTRFEVPVFPTWEILANTDIAFRLMVAGKYSFLFWY